MGMADDGVGYSTANPELSKSVVEKLKQQRLTLSVERSNFTRPIRMLWPMEQLLVGFPHLTTNFFYPAGRRLPALFESIGVSGLKES